MEKTGLRAAIFDFPVKAENFTPAFRSNFKEVAENILSNQK